MGFPALAGGALALALPNQHLAAQETQGRVLWGRKKPLQEWGHALPGFSLQKHSFSYVQILGRVLGGTKKRRRQLAPTIPRF